MLSKIVVGMVAAAMLAVAGCSAKSDVTKLRTLAEQGDVKAQYSLGQCYLRGDGVRRDLVMAYSWLLLAGPSVNAKDDEFRNAASMSMTAAQVAEAETQARKWRQAFEQSRPAKK